jgi:hypothetical protein
LKQSDREQGAKRLFGLRTLKQKLENRGAKRLFGLKKEKLRPETVACSPYSINMIIYRKGDI